MYILVLDKCVITYLLYFTLMFGGGARASLDCLWESLMLEQGLWHEIFWNVAAALFMGNLQLGLNIF